MMGCRRRFTGAPLKRLTIASGRRPLVALLLLAAAVAALVSTPGIHAQSSGALTGIPLSARELGPAFDVTHPDHDAHAVHSVGAITVTSAEPGGAIQEYLDSADVRLTAGGTGTFATRDLAVGKNPFKIKAMLGRDVSTYTLMVTPTASPKLTALAVADAATSNAVTLSPAFVSDSDFYTAKVGRNLAQITFTPTVSAGSAVEYLTMGSGGTFQDHADDDTNTTGYQVDLNGEDSTTLVQLKVTNESEEKSYEVVVLRTDATVVWSAVATLGANEADPPTFFGQGGFGDLPADDRGALEGAGQFDFSSRTYEYAGFYYNDSDSTAAILLNNKGASTDPFRDTKALLRWFVYDSSFGFGDATNPNIAGSNVEYRWTGSDVSFSWEQGQRVALWITEHPPEVSVSANAASVTESVADTIITFTLTPEPQLATPLAVTVNVSETGGDYVTAANESDRTETIPANTAHVEFNVTVAAGDNAWDAHSTIIASIVPNSAAYTIKAGEGSAQTVVLDDDNPAGVVTIGAGSSTQSVTEGLPVTAIVTATTTGDQEPHKDFTASVVADELATPQATAGVDFTADTFAITFPGNTGLHGTNWKRAEVSVWVQTMQVTVVTAQDTIDEPHEAFRVYLEEISAPFTKGTPDTVTITLKDAAPGVTVDPVELTIAEGAIKTYIVVLNTKPTGDVTVAITGHAGTDLTLSGATLANDVLTFTADNWNAAQTVTVTAATDVDTLTDDEVTLTHTASGGDYGSVAAETVTVTITENDTAGVTIDPASLTVTEGGAKDYAVRLDSEPTADVTVAITGHARTDLTLSGDTLTDNGLTFTTDNWNTAQTVTVSAAEDADATADADATLTHTASGGDYGSVAAKTVTVTITENDTAGLTIDPASLIVTEGGAKDYTVRLDSEPTADVTVAITGHARTDLTLSGATLTNDVLTFTTDNWNTAQTVTVTSVEDDDATADADVTLTHTASGGDYGSVAAETVTVTITENDTAGMTIDPASLTVTEGGAKNYTVRLDSEPTANVTVAIAGHAGTDLTLSGPTLTDNALTFTTDNWNAAQTVTVSAVEDDDAVADGEVTLAHTASGGDYGSVAAKTVTVTITENDTAGLTVDPASLTVTEGGAKDYTVRLDSEPTADVTAAITGHARTDLTLSGDTLANDALTFTTGNWNTAQTVTVTAVEDDDAVADGEVTLTHTASGGDYGSVAAKNITVTITENDTAGLTVDSASLTVTEGRAKNYTVRLDSEPTADGTVAITGHAGTDLTLLGDMLANDALTFTTDNWNTAQTVTVSAAEDADATADGDVTLTHTASGGDYGSVAAKTVTVTITENDTAGVTIDPASLTVTEGGAKDYAVRLDSEPTADVTVAITGHSRTDLTLSGDTLTDNALTFTTDNWNTAQTVTVSAAEDADATADADATLTHTASGGDYGSVAAKTVTVTITENDTGGLTIDPASLTVTEGGAKNYTVRLDSEPTANVTVAITGHARTDLALSGVTLANDALTFTTDNWNTAQTVTVSAAEDADATADPDVTLTHTASGGDYGIATAQTVTVAITENDTEGLTIDPASLTVTESGANTYTVRLDSEPTADVTVAITGHTGTDLTLSGGTLVNDALTFTTDNWNAALTVTVSAAEDADAAADADVTLTHTASGGGYGSAAVKTVTVTITENDTAGVTIDPASLTVTEGGAKDYTVRLDSEPTADVTVAITGHGGTDLTLSGATLTNDVLTFTTDNWNTAQTVTVTSVEDDDATADADVTLTHTASGGSYGSVAAKTVTVTITENDTAGLTIDPASLTVTEGGAKDYTVRLDSEPTADVTVAITGHARTDLTLSGATLTNDVLTFTTDNWNTAQAVTVTAVEDADATADADVTLTHTASGGGYGSAAVKTVTVTITENDTAGLTIDPASLTVAEGGAKDYTVRLDSEPTADVTVAITGHGGTDLTLSGATLANDALAFTTDNWNTAQTVTVSAAEDADATADADVTITHTASGGDYGSVAAKTVTVTIKEYDEQRVELILITGGEGDGPASAPVPAALPNNATGNVPGVSVSPSEMTVTKGATGTYTVVLNSRPSSAVTISVNVPAGNDISANPLSLTFSTGNWSTPQMVTVSAAEGSGVQDGSAVTITHSPSGGGYDSARADSVTVAVKDNHPPGVTISPIALTIQEGNSADYTVALDSQPAVPMTIICEPPANTGVSASPATLTFTKDDWDRERTITVSAAKDAAAVAGPPATLVHHVSGSAEYATLTLNCVTVTTLETDTQGVIISPTALTVAEGSSNRYTVALNSQPTGPVTVYIDGHSGTELTLSTTTLTFTAADWDTGKTVAVTARQDADTIADPAVSLVHTVRGADYEGIEATNLVVTIKRDDSRAPVTVGPIRPDASVASPLPTPEITIRWAGSDPALVIDEGGELVVEVSRSAGWDDVLTGVRLEVTETGNVLHYQVLMTNRDGEYVSVDLPLAPPLELDFPNTGLSTMTMKLALYTKDENVDEDDSEVTFKLLPDTRHPKRYTVGDADAVTITVRDNDAPDLAPTATPEPALSPMPKIPSAATTESTPEPTPTPAATLQPTPPPVPPAAPAETDSEDPPLTPAVMLVLLLLPLALVAWLIRRWWRRRR